MLELGFKHDSFLISLALAVILDEVEVVKKGFFEEVEVHWLRRHTGAFAIKRFLAVILGTKQVV